MQKSNRMIGITITLLIFLALTATGCGLRRPSAEKGKPIEPLAPGSDNGQLQALQGHFSVKTTEVQIHGLSVTASGELTAVGTASRSVYLLEQGGKLRWENSLESVPLQTLIDPTGTFVYVGTAGGQLLRLNVNRPDHNRAEVQFDAPVSLLSLSADGEFLLAGMQSESETEADKIAFLDRAGSLQWEREVEKLLDARIAGPDNRVYLNWLEKEEAYFGSFSQAGKELWRVSERVLFAVDSHAQTLVSTNGSDVFGYHGGRLWQYNAGGAVSRLVMAEDGSHIGVLTVDEATRSEDLIYLRANGRELWRKRLPADSDIVISPDGSRIIVASWRQYRDDATHVIIYSEQGEEVNVLEVAGRAQKMALAGQTAMIVLGLEDGTIYFLNVSEPGTNAQLFTERTLQEYYSPVDFRRDEGESRLTLFFFDENAETLVPVTRRVKRTQSLLRASIDELIRGPVHGSHLNRTIPKDAEINVAHNDGVVQIDLPAALDEMAGTTFLYGILESLLLTVSQFPTVEQILFTVAGEQRETFGREGLHIGEPQPARRYGRSEGVRLVYVPARSGDKYYLGAQAEPFVSLKDRALIEVLVRFILEQSRPLFAQELNLQDVRIEKNVVRLNFSESFNGIITNNPEAAARAAALRDALALTIAENTFYSQIEILVDGQPPLRPEIYLPWKISVTRPYYVNLEH